LKAENVEIETIDCQQGSDEWRAARAGMVTCSSLKNVLAKGEGKTRDKYMRQLAGEIITGRPVKSYTNEDMERGHQEEPVARDLLTIYLGGDISTVGFVKNRTLRLGCSPDGYFGEKIGLEIKSALPDIQIERLKMLKKYPGWIPSEYRLQVEGSLVATGRESWKFMSFCPGAPPMIVDVTLTDQRRTEIETELAAFNAELDALVTEIKGMF
jgi:hypothetical protein